MSSSTIPVLKESIQSLLRSADPTETVFLDTQQSADTPIQSDNEPTSDTKDSVDTATATTHQEEDSVYSDDTRPKLQYFKLYLKPHGSTMYMKDSSPYPNYDRLKLVDRTQQYADQLEYIQSVCKESLSTKLLSGYLAVDAIGLEKMRNERLAAESLVNTLNMIEDVLKLTVTRVSIGTEMIVMLSNAFCDQAIRNYQNAVDSDFSMYPLIPINRWYINNNQLMEFIRGPLCDKRKGYPLEYYQ